MQLKVIRMHDDAQLPAYQTPGAAGFDLCSVDNYTIPAGASASIRTGVGIEIPDGHMLRIVGRSGLAFKHDIAAHVGTVDADFRGEIRVKLWNLGTTPFEIRVGDRIAQAILVPIVTAELTWSNGFTTETLRGADGFGSTGR